MGSWMDCRKGSQRRSAQKVSQMSQVVLMAPFRPLEMPVAVISWITRSSEPIRSLSWGVQVSNKAEWGRWCSYRIKIPHQSNERDESNNQQLC
jgi:hypothetical protein